MSRSMHSYQVVDDHGIFGSYHSRADAVSACRILQDNGTNPKVFSTLDREDETISLQLTEDSLPWNYKRLGIFASRYDYADVEKIIKKCEMDGLNYELTYVVHYGFEKVRND